MKNFSVISMSGVYESQDFYKPLIQSGNYIDCTSVSGTNCYADDDALNVLRQHFDVISPYSLHFIDSGNYHYLSLLFLEKIDRDFELILIDKHPDCKIPMFEDMISCGSWIKEALYNLPHLQRVYMIGTDTDLLYELDEVGSKRSDILVVRVMDKLKSKSDIPVYLSIDKDVMSEEVVKTNWDQGTMSLGELQEWLDIIYDNHSVLGVDICGEPDVSDSAKTHIMSSDVNKILLSYFRDRL